MILYYKPAPPYEEKHLWEELVMAQIDYWHTKMPYLGSRKFAVRLQNEDGIDDIQDVLGKIK